MIATSNQYIIFKSIPSINYRELKTKFNFNLILIIYVMILMGLSGIE